MIVAGLLVSVRSVDEARAAFEGGASIIDVKEPARGPLGCADLAVWKAVRDAIPAGIPVSIALGELPEWSGRARPHARWTSGVAYRKIGLAGAGLSWSHDWSRLRDDWDAETAWVAVAYSDWVRAKAPHPDDVLDTALAMRDCPAILVDTWDKSTRTRIDGTWLRWFSRARQGGLKTALAGGLDEAAIDRLSALRPDWFAVRGAACRQGDRHGLVDADLVARLVRQVSRVL